MFWQVHVVIWFLRAMIFALLLLFLTCQMELGLFALLQYSCLPARWRCLPIMSPSLLCLRKPLVWAAVTWNEAELRTVFCTQRWHGWALRDAWWDINCPRLMMEQLKRICVFLWKCDIQRWLIRKFPLLNPLEKHILNWKQYISM